MNFYEHQDRARRRSRWLVVWFVLAVALIVTAIEVVAWLLDAGLRTPPVGVREWLAEPRAMLVAVTVLAVIAAGSLYTSVRLRGGGPALARMLGARRVDPATGDRRERRLVNVVEEMSIASGTPVPALYVLDDESAINAFVAGTGPSATVLVVTRGALDSFTRDELQGVVAHEYSHIFNHDMRLNLRLMGLLAGILLLAQLGRLLLRAGRGGGRQAGQALLLGVALFVIGYVGLLCSNVIKAAISRQREYLADAQAVQFTRHPDGLAGALHRIQQHPSGSLLRNAHADDLSHFCFGQSVRGALGGLLATHPPLARRIRALNPQFAPASAGADANTDLDTDAYATVAADVPDDGAAAVTSRSLLDPAAIAMSVAAPLAVHGEHARRWRAQLPPSLAGAVHDREQAVNVVLALVLAASSVPARAEAAARIEAAYGAATRAAVETWLADIALLGRPAQLPLLKLALPALSLANPAERTRLLATLRQMIDADRRLTTFEFALLRVLARQLGTRAQPTRTRHFTTAAVAADLGLVLSALAHADAGAPAAAAASFARAVAPFASDSLVLLPPASCTLAALDTALERLAGLAPLLKRNVIQACADAVLHDGNIAPAEAELLETVALALDCPLPPLLRT